MNLEALWRRWSHLGLGTALSLSMATTASAQWKYTESGSEIFPRPSAYVRVDAGSALSLFCGVEGGPTIVLDTDRSPRNHDNTASALEVAIDGRGFSLPVTYVPSEELAYGPADAQFVAALMAGSRATVRSRELGDYDFGLQGSSVTLRRALASCGGRPPGGASGPAEAEGTNLEALRTALLAKLEPECRDSGGNGVVIAPAAFRGSGAEVTVDYHHIRCPGAMGVLAELGVGRCGAAECLQEVYVLRSGRYGLSRSYYR